MKRHPSNPVNFVEKTIFIFYSDRTDLPAEIHAAAFYSHEHTD